MTDGMGIDWNAVWRERYEENVRCRSRGECASIWESQEKARDFLNQSRENPHRIRRGTSSWNDRSNGRVC